MAIRKKTVAKGRKATATATKKTADRATTKKTLKTKVTATATPKAKAKKVAAKPKAKTSVRKTAARKPAAPKATAPKATAPKATATKATATKRVSKKVDASKLPSTAISQKQTKAQIIADIAEMTSMGKPEVKKVFAALKNLVERHVKPKGSGEVTLPELGIKIRRIVKKATKARTGRNPFTGEDIKIAAKPARKSVKATALKMLKELA